MAGDCFSPWLFVIGPFRFGKPPKWYYLCAAFKRRGHKVPFFCFIPDRMYTEEIQELLTKKFEEESFRDCFLVEIEQHGKTVRVFVDSDSGMTFEKCQKLSRYLEHVFDEKSWFGSDYTLEVSSPGITRPLLYPRQYCKNIGRGLQVKLADGSQYEGTILDADQQQITLTREEVRKEGKKKIKETIEMQLPYEAIAEAKIMIKI